MNTPDSISRRSVIQGLATLGAFSALGASRSSAQGTAAPKAPAKGTVILFQGDSITDAGRKRDAVEANSERGLARVTRRWRQGNCSGHIRTRS